MVCSIFEFDVQWLNASANINIIKSHVLSQDRQLDLLILPEMFLSGFCMDPTQSACREDGEEIARLIELAASCDIGIMGSLSIEENGHYYNRVLLLTGNGIQGRYDKQYLYSPSGENNAYEHRYGSSLMDYKGWKILPQVCYDLRFPENVRHLPAPDVLVYMANWPSPRIHHWDALLKARAIENLCFVVGCNRIGKDGNDWSYPGRSQWVKPDGTTLLLNEMVDKEPIVFDQSILQDYREKYKFLQDKK